MAIITKQNSANLTSSSQSYTVSSGANRLLVVTVFVTAGSITSMTYGGVSMTKASLVPSNYPVQIWYLVNPASGSNTLANNWGGGGAIDGTIIDFTNAIQSSAVIDGSVKSDPSPASSDTLNITTSNPNTFIVDIIHINNNASLTVGGSQTQLYNNAGIGGSASSYYTTLGAAGTYGMAWTFGSSQFGSHVAVGFASIPTNYPATLTTGFYTLTGENLGRSIMAKLTTGYYFLTGSLLVTSLAKKWHDSVKSVTSWIKQTKD